MHASSFSSSRRSVEVRVVAFSLLCKIQPVICGRFIKLRTDQAEYNSHAGENGSQHEKGYK